MIAARPEISAPPARNTPTPASRLKSILGGSVGNLVEWYDWFVYSSFSIYFAGSFFPKGDLTAQLLNTAAIFAVGFLARPVGGWILGVYADRRGRKAALTLSVFVMCLGSLLIAAAPTYQAVGVASPILLVIARLLQGLSVGGEYGASTTYLSEMATPGRRGLYTSLHYVTMILGQLLAVGVLIVLQRLLLSEGQIERWGWRIPFGLGAIFALVALYMRRGLEETRSFAGLPKSGPRRRRLAMLLDHRRAVLAVAGLTLGGTIAFYTFTAYMPKYLVNSLGWSRDHATLLSAATLFIFMLLQPAFGALSDRIGRRPFLVAFGALGTLLSVPILTALGRTPSAWIAFLLILGALVIVSGYTSVSAAVKADLFPAEIRALGVGFPHAVIVSIFGGTVECVALGFKRAGHEGGFYGYVAVCIALAWWAGWVTPETRGRSALDRD
jgi:MHS family alpha-ketoglutarate permease-like MFS transporter